MTTSRDTIQQSIDNLPIHRRAWITWKLFRDPRVSPGLKRAIIFGAAAYVLSPVDVIPDLFLGVGQLDDLGLVVGLMFLLSNLLVRFAPEDVLSGYLEGTYGGSDPDGRGARRSTSDDDDIDVPFRVR